MTNIHYKLVLNNNIEYVFNKLFDPEYYGQWTKPFLADSKLSGTFAVGEQLFFSDNDGNGMKAEVTVYDINKMIELTYTSSIEDGVETKFENSHRNYERYTFTNMQDNLVMLDISLYIPKEYLDFFEEAWAKSVVIIQDLFDNEEE